jgi:hypothetical protein
MSEYCEVCGEELDENERYEGICSKCKRQSQEEYKKDEDYIDPGIT